MRLQRLCLPYISACRLNPRRAAPLGRTVGGSYIPSKIISRETQLESRALAWLASPQRLSTSATKLLNDLCNLLNDCGLQIGRANVVVRTLHPQLEMLIYVWRPTASERVAIQSTERIVGREMHAMVGGEVERFLVAHGHGDEAMFRSSPFYSVLTSKERLRIPLRESQEEQPFPIVKDLLKLGLTDYVVFYLELPSPYSGCISFASSRPGGFTEIELEALESLRPLLAMVLTHQVSQQASIAILSTYIGKDPARQVMEGNIRLGDVHRLKAVIGFIDLKDFTQTSNSLEGEVVVGILGTFFNEVHEAIKANHGEILKFMGDGAMFVFPLLEQTVEEACDAAISACALLKQRIDAINLSATGPMLIGYGVGLHLGEVLYGNIGALERLDFTVVGPAVNLTARIEGLTRTLNTRLVVSTDFAAQCPDLFTSAGLFELKGFEDPIEAFIPKESLTTTNTEPEDS
jgi:adenylate cyclase